MSQYRGLATVALCSGGLKFQHHTRPITPRQLLIEYMRQSELFSRALREFFNLKREGSGRAMCLHEILSEIDESLY
jgi:hypothetical protein